MLPAAHQLPGPGQDDQGEAAPLPGSPAGARGPGGGPAEHVGLGEGRARQAGLRKQHRGEQGHPGKTAVTDSGTPLSPGLMRLDSQMVESGPNHAVSLSLDED